MVTLNKKVVDPICLAFRVSIQYGDFKLGYNFEVDNEKYIDIIDSLVNFGDAIVGDYNITLDNQNADNLELLNEAKKQILKYKKGEKK